MKRRISSIVFLLVVVIVVLFGFQKNSFKQYLEPEVEPALEIESWMIDESFWNRDLNAQAPAEDSVQLEWAYNDID
ncbi:MAG TPA: hypothetical protein VKA27_02765 [Sunxiuqinia sp.]|nr:hypothetical protein [Sunxiuqinia sp.]